MPVCKIDRTTIILITRDLERTDGRGVPITLYQKNDKPLSLKERT